MNEMTPERWALIERLKARIPYAHINFQINDGWFPLVADLEGRLAEFDPNYVVLQVKEKFGGLRFAVRSESAEFPKMRELADIAEQQSFHICEVCGRPGEVRSIRSWDRTLCEEHHTGG